MQKKIYLEQLGCAKNLTEGERIIGGFIRRGTYKQVFDPNDADIVLINTCSFIQASQVESIDTILQYESYAERGEKEVWVTGCFIDSHLDELRSSFSNAIQLIPLESFDHPWTTRELITHPGSAYLKIAEGCNRRCSFCTIPLFKGNLSSRSISELIQETQYLINTFQTRELILVAQDTSTYGMDLGNTDIFDLVEALENQTSIEWIRLLYLYPDSISDEFMRWMKEQEKVCPYLDVPIQHTDDTMLKRMQRPGGRKAVMEAINAIKKHMPQATIRTTIMVGFPGESDSHFDQLLSDIQSIQFNWLGAFMYSDEQNAPSFHLKKKIREAIKTKRYEHLLDLQQSITYTWLRSRIGTQTQVLIEEVLEQSIDEWGDVSPVYSIGRSPSEAPDVDGSIVLPNLQGTPGQLVSVRINQANNYDLVGSVV
jgi:ribosomal protein S12 methylthiotransferase